MNRATTLGGTGFTATAHHEFTADKPEYGASGRGRNFGIHQPGKADATDQQAFKKSVFDLLGKGINFSNLSTVNLDRKSGYARATTGLTEAIEGSASVIATTVAAGILESQDPIKAVLSVEVQSEEKVVITRKYIVGGAAEVTPERAPARAVSVKQDVREFFMARFGCDIEMDLNLFLRPEEAKEDLDLKMNAQTIQLDNKLIELGYEAVMNDATDVVDAIMRSNPAYAALDQQMSRRAFGGRLSDDDAAFKVLLAADRVYCTQVFGALAKNAYAVPNLLAAVKFASAYMLGSIENPVIILPHGPNLKPYTKKEYLNYSVAGIPGASRKPIDMKIDRAFVDEVSGAKIMVHYPRPQYQSGSARPTVGSGGLSRETTVHTYYHDIEAQKYVSDFINGGLTKCGGSSPDEMPKPFAYTPNPMTSREGVFPAGYAAAVHGFIYGNDDLPLFGGQASTIAELPRGDMAADWGDNYVNDDAYTAMYALFTEAVDGGTDAEANTRVSVAFYLAMTFGNHMAAAARCMLPLISFHRVLASMVVFDENVGETMTDDDVADEVRGVMFDIKTDGKLGFDPTAAFNYDAVIGCPTVTGDVQPHWNTNQGKAEAKAVATNENSTMSDMAVGFLKLRLGMDVNNSSGNKILGRIIRSWAIRTKYFQAAETVRHANKPGGRMPHPFGGLVADNFCGTVDLFKAALDFTHDPFSFGQAIRTALRTSAAANAVKQPTTWQHNENIIGMLIQVPWLFSTIGTIEGDDADREQTFCAMQVMATMKPDVGNAVRDASVLLAAARGPANGIALAPLDAAVLAAIARMGPVLAALSGGGISDADVGLLKNGDTGLSAPGTIALAATVKGMRLLGDMSASRDPGHRQARGMFHLNGYSGPRGAFTKEPRMSISSLCDSLTTGPRLSWIRTTTCHMASAIVAAPGGRAGRLMVGYPMTGVSTSTATEAARIQLRMYMGAAVTDPESIMVLPNVSFEGISADEWTHIVPSEKQKREMEMGSPVQLTNFKSHLGTDDKHAVVHQGSVFKRGRDGALVQIKTNTGHFGKLDHPDSYAKLWGSQVYNDTM